MKKFGWFIGGALLGAIAAFLFAPASGKETRSRIFALVTEKFPDLTKQEVEKFVDQIMNKIGDENIEANVDED
ncbi:MAG: YtxH domain-containing protein [Paludibacteraceae bacterium]|nr:YtxH domain-containing protein [Paludibacteraceae bacterium]